MKIRSLLEQIIRIYPIILMIYIPTFLVLLTVGFISWRTSIPIMDFTRDPASILDAPVYLGIISNIGILFWAAGATVCFFSAAIINQVKHESRAFYFLLFGGIITTILLADDFFLFHERIFPQYLNTSESQAFLIYLLILLAYLIIFRKKIMTTDFMLLGLSLLGFAMSAIVDEIFVDHFRGKFLAEDGFKLLGILTWAAYFMTVGITDIKNSFKNNFGNF